jgi:putative colanic acid biosynthesis acetyltransferase WcaF
MSQLARTSFPLRHRLFRALWQIAWFILAAWTPPPFHPWRCLILRIFGARIGPGVRIHASARIWYPPNLNVESGVVIGWRSVIYCQAPITIRANAVVSQDVHLLAGSHDVDGPGFLLVTAPIDIGPDAWIAARATVGPGVVLGARAILGAGGVAFSDIPAGEIHIGNPAHFLRHRAITTPWPHAPHETLSPPPHSHRH